MDPDGLLSRIAPYAACCIVSALVFLILGWAAAKKGARLPGWLSALANRLGGLGNQEAVTEEQLLDLVDDAGEQEVIDDDQAEMISSVVELADVTAGHIMTHRTDMTVLEENMPCREAVETALASGCSRMPVYRKTVDEIVGILYVKDLLVLMRRPEEAHLPVRELMRPAMFVPESCPAQRLLLDFRRRHTMMAVVVDEYGGTAGLVTMEDVLEEIVGSIQDEYDQEDEELAPVEGGYLVDGALDLKDVFDAFEMELPPLEEGEEFGTVAGLITERLGRFPEPGEAVTVHWGGLCFAVVKAEERRVVKVKVTKDSPESSAEPSGKSAPEPAQKTN